MKKKIFKLLSSYWFVLRILVMSTIAAVIITSPIIAVGALIAWIFHSKIITSCILGIIAFILLGWATYKCDIVD